MAAKKDAQILQAEFIDGVRRAQSLNVIYSLKIHSIVNENDRFLSAEDICKQITGKRINAIYLERIMKYLSSFGIFEEKHDEEGKSIFGSTEFLKLPAVFKMQLDYQYLAPFYLDFLEGKTRGNCLFEHVFGSSIWEYLSNNEEKRLDFVAYMESFKSDLLKIIPKIINEIKVEKKEDAVIVDVGGSNGYILDLLRKDLPLLKCINFDLPEVIGGVKPIDQIKMVAGDMFKVDTIPKCNVLFTKNILHDWSDENCIKFLKNFYEVLDEGGILLSVNYHYSSQGENNSSWQVRAKDLIMMECFGAAKERSLAEYEKIHNSAGFSVKRYVILGPEHIPSALLICEKRLELE